MPRKLSIILLIAAVGLAGCTLGPFTFTATVDYAPTTPGLWGATVESVPLPERTPQPTVLPLPTMTPDTEPERACIVTLAGKGARLNVRGGPGTDYAVVGTVFDGVKVVVVEESGDWLKIKSPAGWIAGWLCE